MDLMQRTFSPSKPVFKIMLCLMLVLLIATETRREVSAQSAEGITITAKRGLDDLCKVDSWLPVHINVENKGADIADAHVQVSYQSSSGGKNINQMDISLPASSRKEFFLYVTPESYMQGFKVSVLSGNKIVAEQKLYTGCPSEPLTIYGVIAKDPSTFDELRNLKTLAGDIKIAHLKIEDLPDQAQGWEMMNALVISNVDTGTLTSAQKRALELWIARGGKLLVVGGSQWQLATAGISDLLPVQIDSLEHSPSLSSLSTYIINQDPLEADFTLAAGTALEGANVMVSQGGIPVLAEKQIGFGKVYFFAADPGLRPLSEWTGMQDVYTHLLAYPSSRPAWSFSNLNSYNASNALATLPELSLPPFLYVCGWLGLYVLIIGPVNYVVLRRMKRTEWAWVSVPVLVIIFTGFAYFSGTFYRGTQPIMNRLMLMQSWQGVNQADTKAVVGIYSPNRNTYNLETSENYLFTPSGSFQGANDWLTLKGENGTVLPDTRVEIGGMESLNIEGSAEPVTIQHDLTITLSEKNPLLSGTITNTSPYTLKQAVIVTSSGWKIIGDIAPNSTRKVSSTLFGNTSVEVNSITSAMGWESYPATGESIEERRRSAFFTTVFTSQDYGYLNTTNVTTGVYLMAWIENEITIPLDVQDESSSTIDTVMFFEKLTPALKAEPGVVKISSSLYGWQSSTGESVSQYNDDYIIHFEPDMPLHFKEVKSFYLNIGLDSTNTQLDVTLWNYQDKTWETLNIRTRGAQIPNPEKYIGVNGEILIKLISNQNNYDTVQSIDFTLMVQP